MTSLDELLGHDAVAEKIVDELGDEAIRVGRLTGPAGCGKTHVALLAGATWRERGGECVVALGDSQNSARQLYPFLSGLAALPSDWRGIAKQGSRSILRVADVLVGSGGAAGSVFDLLTSAFRQRTERALRTLSSIEREIVLDLRRLARKKQLLLIADNAHWWDGASLSLLREVVSDRVRAAIPELRSVSILLVDTAEQQGVTAEDEFRTLCEGSRSKTWTLQCCAEADFGNVLGALGLSEQLPDEILAPLFSATGGHLKLAEQLVAYLDDGGSASLHELGRTDLFTSLLAARIASLGAAGAEVTQLLSMASVIGIGFDERELQCLAGPERTDLAELLARAQTIRFLDLGPGRAQFSHEVLRSFFLERQESHAVKEFRRRLAECLTLIRPSDYETRAALFLEAKDLERGRELFALALVSGLRRGQAAAKVIRDARAEFPDDRDLLSFIEVAAEGYQAVAAGEFGGALPLLKTSSPSETTLMAAERNYLAALCSMELQTEHGFAEARAILNTWEAELREEPELHLRYLLLLQQAQVLSEMFDEARQTEKVIERRLIARSRHDVEAAAMLQVQNRRSAALNAPEIAEARIREAVEFFRRGTGDQSRDTLELYRGLNNLAAILIRLGRDAEALAVAVEAERLALDDFEVAPRLDVLASNLILAGLRCDALTAGEAAEKQRAVVESADAGGDNFIHRCNLVAFQLLGGDDEGADGALSNLEAEISAHGYSETYLLYYSRALRVSYLALRGDPAAADAHHALSSLVENLRWPGAPYLRRRQALLNDTLGRIGAEEDRSAADRMLLAEHPEEIGAAWSYYGRVVPCCELAFWSDS